MRPSSHGEWCFPHVVAAGELVDRSTVLAPLAGLCLLHRGSELGRSAQVYSLALARLLPSAVRVRTRSRCRSARPPRAASINRPVLVAVGVHGSARLRNCAPASAMRLTMANRRHTALRKPRNANLRTNFCR
jgi:hypothetical protein